MTKKQLSILQNNKYCMHFFCDDIQNYNDEMITEGRACCICTEHNCWKSWDYKFLLERNIQRYGDKYA